MKIHRGPIVVFRQLDPPGRIPGIAWIAELHSPDDCPPYQLATAWLTDFTGLIPGCVMLDFILVPDHLRRKGYASQLIRACQDRWPNLEFTDEISTEGEALLSSVSVDTIPYSTEEPTDARRQDD